MDSSNQCSRSVWNSNSDSREYHLIRSGCCGLVPKGHSLKQGFVADLVCFDKIIVELKAVSRLVDEHRAQVLNYLNASGFKLGLLVNFGHHPKLEWERIVL